MTISPTQHRVLSWLLTYGPAGSATIAEAHGFGQSTARTHLHRLRQAGYVKASGLGTGSTWHAVRDTDIMPPTRRSIADRTDTPSAIWQCPSVWVYAARLQALDKHSKPMV